MRVALAAALCAAAQSSLAEAQPEVASKSGFEESLRWETGEVTLSDGLARLSLTPDWRFLRPKDAERVLVEWGNPAGVAPLGMVFPADVGPFDDDGWAVVVTYQEDGHVSDADAASHDYAALLKDMQAETKAGNAERVRDGYQEVELIGWAAPPYYDPATHKLHWARELRFGDDPTHTLNYDVRVLGRRGVLVMKAVAYMRQAETVQTRMRDVLSLVEFTAGNRYEDFDSSADKVAAYGIGGLVAGGLLTKAGFFKALLAALVAGKKLVAVGVLAAGAGFARWFRRRSAASDSAGPT